jgi:LysR family transcriptional regulator, transcriptional activator of nhaA
MNFLNYHHLRYFWMTAREGSLRAAAEALHLSQPTISAQISALEDSLSIKLFHRTGRGLTLTEAGRRVFEMAEEIFALGQELLQRAQSEGGARALRVELGLADTLPKLVTWELILPIFSSPQPVQLLCREGKAAELLAQLALNRLDVVLADEPAPSGTAFRVFSHELGSCGVTFCAAAHLAKSFRGKDFATIAAEAPALLPAPGTAWRHTLDAWFRRQEIAPKILAEFDDAALLKAAGQSGLGWLPIPDLTLTEALDRYGLRKLGRAPDCRLAFYAITPQRRSPHPAVATLIGESRQLFAKAKKPS